MDACYQEDQHRQIQGIEANIMSMLRSKQSASSSCSSSSLAIARTFRNRERDMGGHHVAGWSMSSVLTTMPESPSPICSHASNIPLPTHTPNSHYLDYATDEFSSPRNQLALKSESLGIAYIDNNDCSNCFSDIDEWLEHANKFCKPYNSHTNHFTETVDLRRNASPEEDMTISAICNTFLTAPEHEVYNITLPSIREESPVLQGQTRLSCIYGAIKSATNERTSLLSRTKPYGELWNEVGRRKHEVESEARNKAKHDELVNRMRRKEDAIDNWELQQTRKAMDDMDKIQNKLERKQLMASARTQKQICLVREKAEKQKLNLRRRTLKRFQQLQISGTKSTTESSWGSRLPLC